VKSEKRMVKENSTGTNLLFERVQETIIAIIDYFDIIDYFETIEFKWRMYGKYNNS